MTNELKDNIRDARTMLMELVKSDAILSALYNLNEAVKCLSDADSQTDAAFYCNKAVDDLDKYVNAYTQ